jgi:hypothetical protein
MTALASFLDKIRLARSQSHRNMVMFPMLAPATEDEPEYITLEEGLNNGAVAVREVSEAGSVPDLLLINAGDKPVLVLDGEELVGAKQNRIVNTTMLVAAKSELVIPVSCVEQGRWQRSSLEFSSGKRMMYASLRAAHQDRTHESLARGEGHRSDQGMIWGELGAKAERMSTRSRTGAMGDLFTLHEKPLLAYLRAFRRVDCQVGSMFAINGRLVGMDVLGHQPTFTSFFDKVVRSYALDALDWSTDAPHDSSLRSERAKSLLEQMASASMKVYPGVGLGESVRFEGRSVLGAALIHEGRVLHLAAFRNDSHKVFDNETRVRLQRASARRRRVVH